MTDQIAYYVIRSDWHADDIAKRVAAGWQPGHEVALRYFGKLGMHETPSYGPTRYRTEADAKAALDYIKNTPTHWYHDSRALPDARVVPVSYAGSEVVEPDSH